MKPWWLLAVLLSRLMATTVEEQLGQIEKRLGIQEQRLSLANEETSYTLGGRVQFDAALSSQTHTNNIYDYFVTPKSFTLDAPTPQTTMQARESRFWLKTHQKTPQGTLRALIEVDFGGDPGNENVTNSRQMRIRHAYVSYNDWTVGQTNSTFMGTSMPDIIFLASGIAFVRQPLVRYSWHGTLWHLDAALENAQTVASGKSYNDDAFYDTVMRLRYETRTLQASFSTMVRSLNVLDRNNTAINFHAQSLAWAVNESVKYTFENNDYIQGAFAYGKGMGRYVAFAYVNDAMLDSTHHTLTPVELLSTHLSYTHRWNAKLRSTLLGSYLLSNALSHWNIHANMRYAPMPQTLISVEFHTGATYENQISRRLDRLLTSFSYIF